jgi:hypothetical protein
MPERTTLATEWEAFARMMRFNERNFSAEMLEVLNAVFYSGALSAMDVAVAHGGLDGIEAVQRELREFVIPKLMMMHLPTAGSA